MPEVDPSKNAAESRMVHTAAVTYGWKQLYSPLKKEAPIL